MYEMHGLMMEHVRDTYAPYPPGPVVDPLNTGGNIKVLRGGYYGGAGVLCRSADRINDGFSTRAYFYGFRIVGRKPSRG